LNWLSEKLAAGYLLLASSFWSMAVKWFGVLEYRLDH